MLYGIRCTVAHVKVVYSDITNVDQSQIVVTVMIIEIVPFENASLGQDKFLRDLWHGSNAICR